MDNPFYHRGLTIEFDSHIPRLTVDGQEIGLPPELTDRTALKKLLQHGPEVLIQHAKRYVDSSPELQARDAVRDEHVQLLRKDVKRWNKWRLEHPDIRPLLYNAKLRRKDLRAANLANANLISADLREARLDAVNLHEANLGGAKMMGAKLARANFCRTDLFRTNLSHADLTSANLQGTHLAKTNFSHATLSHCRIYGLAAWDLGMREIKQKDLEIVYEREGYGPDGRREVGRIIVDDLRVAQFIYLLLHNSNLRGVIDTVSKKAVLLLGRFTARRMPVLEAMRDWLRSNDYVPIVFNVEGPVRRDHAETILILAGMSRFVIADLTTPRSVPAELQLIVPHMKTPLVPIIKKGERPYDLFDSLRAFGWVVEPVEYRSLNDLVARMKRDVVGPALRSERKLRPARRPIRRRPPVAKHGRTASQASANRS